MRYLRKVTFSDITVMSLGRRSQTVQQRSTFSVALVHRVCNEQNINKLLAY